MESLVEAPAHATARANTAAVVGLAVALVAVLAAPLGGDTRGADIAAASGCLLDQQALGLGLGARWVDGWMWRLGMALRAANAPGPGRW